MNNENIQNAIDTRLSRIIRVHITNHSRKHKLAGIQSVSTSVLLNPICAKRRCNGGVCANCYAARLTKCRKNLQPYLEQNAKILTDHLLEDWEIPQFTTVLGRFEAFGDVINVTHARNYLRIAKGNPFTHFAAWTKNPGIWLAAFHQEGGKPENMTFVLSSFTLNAPDPVPAYIAEYVDHVFTVYDAEHYDFEGKPEECAALSCATCRKCYQRGGSFHIAELLRTGGGKKKSAKKTDKKTAKKTDKKTTGKATKKSEGK